MQKDFHYYCVFVLANLAKFTPNEAKVIAYCSQYVDDSIDSDQINVGEFKFDTVRTAHQGIKSFSWNVHKKIYFPFHFIPPLPLRGQSFSYITKANSPFAQMLVNDAIADKTDLRLYRIGVALHTYADTWAHEHFSGRQDDENDVKDIRRYENKKWKKCEKPWDFILDWFRARVGHIQAFKHPDYTYEYWRYKDYQDHTYARKNSKAFLKAAHIILQKLASSKETSGINTIWAKNEDKIKNLFEAASSRANNELDQRCYNWIDEYREFFESKGNSEKYQYNPDEWREKALLIAHNGNLKEFLKTDWVQFQRAALKQRYFVLERLM